MEFMDGLNKMETDFVDLLVAFRKRGYAMDLEQSMECRSDGLSVAQVSCDCASAAKKTI